MYHIDADISAAEQADIISEVNRCIPLISYFVNSDVAQKCNIVFLTRDHKREFLRRANQYTSSIEEKDEHATPLSYAWHTQHLVVLDYDNWCNGHTRVGQGTAADYHLYVLAHELGHLLGWGHDPLPAPGALVPIMYQATLGVDKKYVYDPLRAIAARSSI
jgi:hypothetical protein